MFRTALEVLLVERAVTIEASVSAGVCSSKSRLDQGVKYIKHLLDDLVLVQLEFT